MKSAILFTIAPLLGLVHSAAIQGSRNPASSFVTARQDAAWSFSVYQNERCTGARDPYSGSGWQECTRGIRNGSFGSYTIGQISEGCSVYIYNNDNCDPKGTIDVLTAANSEGCRQPLVEATGSASFDVRRISSSTMTAGPTSLQLLQASVDQDGEGDFRILFDNKVVKYISIAPGLFSQDDMCFAPRRFSLLPPPPSGDWNTGRV
ncbi:hypothetical protein FZEAL_7168 [Fusarium zealandicum]|uniref:Uncharacterized protein n=1 Tax=Fusarium zealandicum TaxID=1053134 RepID=A0A8H4XIR6_9HYPO|nr:hypothetical protein FZEAL_7168 [Fusarium zealandicum]